MRRQGVRGFTLIELLIVVVIIGILAAVAIPKFANTKEKAYIAAMKSDLRALFTQQEGYYHDNYTYSTDNTALQVTESAGITITVNNADGMGWDATATHVGTPVTCAMAIGSGVNSIDATAPEGTPACQ